MLRLVDRAVVQVGNPVDLPPASEPEPDLSVLRARDDFYGTGHPEPDDVLLVIEVMDTSARFDRGVKLPMYARARVPEVWLVDAKRDLVEVHRQPSGNRYGSIEVRRRGATLTIAEFPDVTFTVDDAIGPAMPARSR